jgi:sulfopropanediol 3-dehydrogenase
MRINPDRVKHLSGQYSYIKKPILIGESQRSPEVIARVSEMLSKIQKGGRDAVMRYSRELDGWNGADFEISRSDVEKLTKDLPRDLREALELGRDQTAAYARMQREHMRDFSGEISPGLEVGMRYIPVSRVGAYLPAGRFPILASAFMTVNVAKVAGVPSVIVCSPPQKDGRPNPAVLYLRTRWRTGFSSNVLWIAHRSTN